MIDRAMTEEKNTHLPQPAAQDQTAALNADLSVEAELAEEALDTDAMGEAGPDEIGDSVDDRLVPEIAAARSEALYRSSLSNACIAAAICDDLKGQNIVVLDLTRITSIVDFFVIVTGNSRRQMHAIADEVNRKLKHEDGNRRISIEGYRTEGNWILTDYGDVVLHVFTAEGRSLYNLEQLWADAPRIDWKAAMPTSGIPRGPVVSGQPI